MTASKRRCTYCLQVKEAGWFTTIGDHVITFSLGGEWVDPNTCDECNTTANTNADQLIAEDPVVRFLRDAYGIRDRRGPPPPAKFAVRAPEGGVIQVTLGANTATFAPAMAPAVAEQLGLADASQDHLQSYVIGLLGLDPSAPVDSLILARAAQESADKPTPTTAWSRFMAKIGLACGREAYGDAWLGGPHARILSRDVLGDGEPTFAQQSHYPPVEPSWPYEPPKHAMWIERFKDTAVLMIALFRSGARRRAPQRGRGAVRPAVSVDARPAEAAGAPLDAGCDAHRARRARRGASRRHVGRGARREAVPVHPRRARLRRRATRRATASRLDLSRVRAADRR